MTRKSVLLAVLLLLVAAGVIAAALAAPWFFSLAYWQEGGQSTSRSEIVRNLGILAAAVIGLGFGIWRAVTGYMQARASQRQAEAANEQARIAQKGQITDRFSTAVEHLGSEELPVRLGGIYALWRLIEDSQERDVITVIDILCAFVRHPPHEIGQGPDPGASEDGQASAEKAGSTHEIRPDVQTVLNLIGNEKAVYRQLLPAGYRLDLTGANLVDANLTGADLADADLRDANLTNAHLTNANLTDADLTGANLVDANLTGAYLEDAYLTDANLSNADLTTADLTRANLTTADLTGADLTGADLTGARLAFANLSNADLTTADLTRANLTTADLTGADLTGADLTGADLTGTNLTGAKNLTQQQLDFACISKGGTPPTLPEDLKPPQKVCVP